MTSRNLVICCSQRFKSELDDFVPFLDKKGIWPLYPNFRRHRQDMIKKDEEDRLKSESYKVKIPGLVWSHFDNLRKAEHPAGVCLVFNPLTKGRLNRPYGYVGFNTTLEMGFGTRGDLLVLLLKPVKDDSGNVVAHHEDKRRTFTLMFPDKDPRDYEFMYENWLRHWLGMPSGIVPIKSAATPQPPTK